MSHLLSTLTGQCVGSVLSLDSGRLAVCFNQRFPQYKDTEGTPEQVKWTLRNIIQVQNMNRWDMPRLDAWMLDVDRQYAVLWQHETQNEEMDV